MSKEQEWKTPDIETALRIIEQPETSPEFDLLKSQYALRVVVVELARRMRLGEPAIPG